MIHNMLLIKDGICIYSYRAGTKKSLDANLINGLLEAIFGMSQVFHHKKINKILFQEVRTVFRALSKNLILGVVEDIDTDNEVIDVLLKEVSKALSQIIFILEYDGINSFTLNNIPSLGEELKHAFERVLLKIPCQFLRKKWLRKKCTFVEKSLRLIEKSIGRSPLFCNVYESNKCPYLKNEQLWQIYRTPFRLNNGVHIDNLVRELGRWKKTEKCTLHILNENNGTTSMDLRSKLRAYEIDVSPKKALGVMSKFEEKGFLMRGSPTTDEFH